jgi:hypothetical protein
MFLSNDSYCPVNTFTLTKTNPANISEAELVNDTNMMYNIENQEGYDFLVFDSAYEGNFTYYVYGETITNEGKYMAVNQTVQCGTISQEITPIEDEILVSFDKNIGIQELFNATELMSLFSVSDSSNCPIESISIHHPNDALVEVDEEMGVVLDLANRNDNLAGININTTLPSPEVIGNLLYSDQYF